MLGADSSVIKLKQEDDDAATRRRACSRCRVIFCCRKPCPVIPFCFCVALDSLSWCSGERSCGG
ncbi:unnamed protein product, partial [Musa textilis]